MRSYLSSLVSVRESLVEEFDSRRFGFPESLPLSDEQLLAQVRLADLLIGACEAGHWRFRPAVESFLARHSA